MTILLTIVVLGLMITVHELGHFLVAKLSGVKVHEFAIGMGPKLVSARRGETVYSLRAIPVGGFVRMAGEEPGDEDDERGLDKKNPFIRIAVMGAGVVMNFVLAIVLFAIMFMIAGAPLNEALIGEVFPDTPATEIGLETGDRIVEIEGTEISTWDDVTREIKKRPETLIVLKVYRQLEDRAFTLEVTTRQDELTGEGYIGIGPTVKKGSLLLSLWLGVTRTWWFIKYIITSLVLMVAGKIAAQGAGPVGIAQMLGQVARTGFINTLSFVAVLSINVGIFNLLPIPPLDGSRLVLLGVEVVRGKPLDPKRENFIYLVGFALLITFALLVTYKDLQRLNIL